MIEKINKIIKYQILKEFPNALIILDKRDDDYRIIVDKNTYLNDKFKMLIINIKINILLEKKISNVFIVSAKESDIINKLSIKVELNQESHNTELKATSLNYDYYFLVV